MITRLVFLVPFVAYSFSAVSMHLQPGQKITWHTHQYDVTERIEDENSITIVMTRPIHHVLYVPMALKQITRTYNPGQCYTSYEHPTSTTGKTLLTHAGTAAISTSVAALAILSKILLFNQ